MKFIVRSIFFITTLLIFSLIGCAPTTAGRPDPVQNPIAESINQHEQIDSENIIPSRDSAANLVYIDSINLATLESFPIQLNVTLSGHLADGCVSVDAITPQFDGEGWVIDIQSHRQANRMCTAVLAPFEQTISLDVTDVPAGEYTVRLDDHIAHFTLDTE